MKTKAKKTPAAESTHAVTSPSTFKAREICASYLPDEETTKAAERGSMLHLLLQNHGYKATKAKEAKALVEGDEIQLQMVCDYIEPFEKKNAKSRTARILREHKFDLSSLHIPDCDKGTGDLLLLDIDAAHIDLMDYKFGWIEVDDAEDNIQLGIYVLGAFAENPWAKTVMAHILQPARDEVSTHLFTRDDVAPILLRAKTISERVRREGGKTFNPVVDNCLWCDRKGTCLALHAMVLKASKQANLVVPDGVLVPEDFNDVANSGDVYDFAEIVIKWAQAIKYHIIELSAAGNEIPGHELRETNGKASIVDPCGVQELLERDYGVPLADFLAVSNPSITAAQALVAKYADYGEKGKKSQEMRSAILGEGMVATGNPSRFLVRIKTKADKKK
jgi:hypothetical protein